MKHVIVYFLFLISSFSVAQEQLKENNLVQTCINDLQRFPGAADVNLLKEACAKVTVKDDCYSVEGHPIYQFDKRSTDPKAKTILVFSLIHGDETNAGTVGRFWMERLENIDPRNTWRVIPVLNPDGTKYKTRTNAHNIDLNRNFPTRDWNDLAQSFWKKTTHSSPRRFPGIEAASEPETKCALRQIEDFKPDFIVSVHTPLQVLDFDGPKLAPPKYDYLPWKSLGHFPGSLGRYMWFERQTPVLTMELKENLPSNLNAFEKLQDVIGQLVKVSIHGRPADISKVFVKSDHDHYE